MLPDVERETTSSTAKSLVAALLALGAGFLFLFIALVTTIGESGGVDNEASATRVLEQLLRADLVDLVPGTIKVSSDGTTLSFRVHPTQAQNVQYLYVSESGDVFRERTKESRQKIGRLNHLVFAVTANLLSVEWRTSGERVRRTWALHRWIRGGKM